MVLNMLDFFTHTDHGFTATCDNMYMCVFCAIRELAQSRDCVAHSQNPKIALQSQDCTPISRLRTIVAQSRDYATIVCNLHCANYGCMHTIVDIEDG